MSERGLFLVLFSEKEDSLGWALGKKLELALATGQANAIFINMPKYFHIKGCKMPSKSVTLKVDSKTYDNYREYCKKKGLIVSRQFEILMEKELEENGE
ncbi:MAG: hypothetical protein UU24_C0043G0008 [Candidatus Nomurabacteria bacterium GW2011_GWA2_40_9]|uniref:Uncharacterized protein n=1 Tax=Candidatus Nomurabacteria bacterium GW2011_GWA2_40_9 TaxID=1618734 RepID=A0A0G0WRL6_9BACT|nr:MAG: hypothetical protein UU24_C0043G0008 [Candidatus Nomurabacteria bacterium GW2011_GWA2_40_9]